jgi:hypothetical protein
LRIVGRRRGKMAKRASLIGKSVEILWEDAWTDAGIEYTKAEVEAEEPLLCRVLGIVVKDTREGVTVAQAQFQHRGDLAADRGYRQIWHLPRGMVRKVKVLR